MRLVNFNESGESLYQQLARNQPDAANRREQARASLLSSEEIDQLMERSVDRVLRLREQLRFMGSVPRDGRRYR